MRLALIVNPQASTVSPAKRRLVEECLEGEHTVRVSVTGGRDDAAALAGDVARSGDADAVVVFGGDGTLNEAANALAGTDVALAIVPGGSTNVLARTIGMTNDIIGAMGVLLDILGRGRNAWRRVGVGSANGRFFLFHAGAGFDAAVIARVERHAHLKRRLGQLVFVWDAFATWFRDFDSTTPGFDVREPAVGDGFHAIALNSDPYTFLGRRPLHVAPEATLDTPLTLVTIRSLAFWSTLALTGATLGMGKPVSERSHVDYRPGITTADLAGHRPIPLQVDGDYLGEFDTVHLQHHPDALTLIAPTATNE